MQVHSVDRVILATWDLDETISLFEELLGVSFASLMEPTTTTEDGPQEVANVISETGLEIVTPRGEDNEVSRFLEENGPGLYALSLRVEDLETAKSELADEGITPVGEYATGNFVEVFYHPENFGGAMTILAEYDTEHPAVVAAESGE